MNYPTELKMWMAARDTAEASLTECRADLVAANAASDNREDVCELIEDVLSAARKASLRVIYDRPDSIEAKWEEMSEQMEGAPQ